MSTDVQSKPSKVPPIARVVVDVSLDKEFDYAVPDDLRTCLQIGMQVKVPFGRRHAQGFVLGFREESEYSQLKPIAEVIGNQPLIQPPVMELARWMAGYYCSPIENALKTVLPGAVRKSGAKFRKQLFVVPTEKTLSEEEAAALRKRAPKQAAALDLLLSGTEMLVSDLVRVAKVSHATVRAMEKSGFVRITEQPLARDPLAGQNFLRTTPLELSGEQAEALVACKASVDQQDPAVVLLHGVTGSGKTEVYLQAIQYGLDQGKGAIVLVPEISLTPQTVERFRGRFGDETAVLHSHLSDGERHDEWHRVRDGKAKIVVGARSALFAPVHNLGLIVVDEEHEGTYKQEEAPRYNARDMAVMRGHLEGCGVILGSATPSVESVHNAQVNKYKCLPLLQRADARQMPVMQIVDMKHERYEGKPTLFSSSLVEGIRLRITRGEQVILFLNRRGYSSSVCCPTCGHTPECVDCSISLTYHRRTETLRCHLCGHAQKMPQRCPNAECTSEDWKYVGTGTEKVETRIQRIFPQASIKRMDSDTMTSKTAYQDVLGAFRKGAIDILIGTQMIAKGLHFPNVTLVGVLNADTTLHMPDFRAGERAFQLLTQVSGRAGRGDVAGEVIVQTFTPTHPAIQAARRMDFDTFIDQEIEARRELFYPPFSHLVCIHFRGKEERQLEFVAEQMYAELMQILGEDETVRLAPPQAAPIARVKQMFRYQIVARAKKSSQITHPVKHLLNHLKVPRGVQVIVDVDALNLS